MKKIEFKETLNLPLDKTWELFVNLDNYPKYFKYTNKIFYKGEMKLGFKWYDFATFIFPLIVKHEVTIFEKHKNLEFKVYIPLKGVVKERTSFKDNGNTTYINAVVEYDFGNPVFSFLFDNLFEKRMKESINGALSKFKKEFPKKYI